MFVLQIPSKCVIFLIDFNGDFLDMNEKQFSVGN